MNGASEIHKPAGAALKRAGSSAIARDDLIWQFQEQRSEYAAFTERLKSLTEDLLREAGIKCHLIDGRTRGRFKTFDSLGKIAKNAAFFDEETWAFWVLKLPLRK